MLVILIITLIIGFIYLYRKSIKETQNQYLLDDDIIETSKANRIDRYEKDYRDEKNFFSLSYRVKGSCYRDNGAFDSISIGSLVYFELESSNTFDRFAVKVISSSGKHIGYIEQCESESIYKNVNYIKGAEISKIVEGEIAPYIWVKIYFSLDDRLPAKLYDEDIREDEADSAINRIKKYNPLIIKAERFKRGRPEQALQLFLDISKTCEELYPKHECVKIYRRLKMYEEELALIDDIICELSNELNRIDLTDLHLYEYEINKYKERKKYVEKLRITKDRKDQQALERQMNPRKRGRKPKSTNLL